jgi:hypothetical protein
MSAFQHEATESKEQDTEAVCTRSAHTFPASHILNYSEYIIIISDILNIFCIQTFCLLPKAAYLHYVLLCNNILEGSGDLKQHMQLLILPYCSLTNKSCIY